MKKTSSLKTSLLVIASCLSLACMARTFTWTGAGGDNNWSNQANWLKDGATADRLPQSGDSVVLTNTTAGASGNTIDVDVDSASFSTLTFTGTQSYTLTSASRNQITTSGSWYVGAETETATLTVSLTCVLGGKLYVGCDENLPGVLNVTAGADITATRVQVGGKAWNAQNRHGWVYQSGGTVTASDNDAEAFKLGFAGGTIDLPQGANEYTFVFSDSIRESGVLKECMLLTSWGVPEHQIKVAGVYKVPKQNELDDVPSSIVDKGHFIRVSGGATCTAETSVQTIWERQNVAVAGCDYLMLRFDEPVGPGWGLALEGVDGYVRIPEGASGYKLPLDASVIESGVLPKLALVALGQGLPQTIHLEGVYRHSLVKGFAIHLC